ncbi:MAG TPA: type II secretion system F family protein [Burkholderiales bacterium]|nr:type II secretion system F family protein [Burkholderiales bacterium]
MGNLFAAFILLAFIALVLMLEGLYLTWNAYRGPEAKKIERRLRALSAGGTGGAEASILKQRLLSEAPTLQQWLLGLPRIGDLDKLLQQSGSTWSVTVFFVITLIAGIGAFVLVSFVPLLHWALCVLIAVGAGALPFLYILRKRHKRMQQIEQQLPDALDLISRALKAGHAFPSGLQMVSEEAKDPIAGEFRIVHDEVNFGVAVPTALTNLANRVPSTDMRYFIIAVLIQRETGGNLTELLGNISTLIRERLKLLGKVRVLSAEGRMSAWILCALPFVLAGVINLIHPKFMAVLWTDPMGLKMIYAALVMMVLGALWMRKIIRIRV